MEWILKMMLQVYIEVKACPVGVINCSGRSGLWSCLITQSGIRIEQVYNVYIYLHSGGLLPKEWPPFIVPIFSYCVVSHLILQCSASLFIHFTSISKLLWIWKDSLKYIMTVVECLRNEGKKRSLECQSVQEWSVSEIIRPFQVRESQGKIIVGMDKCNS